MDSFEKQLFLEMWSKQFGEIPQNYVSNYQRLTELEKKRFTLLSSEVHQIWNYINTEPIPGVHKGGAATIQEYHERIAPVSSEILAIHKDFNLDLKSRVRAPFRDAYIAIFGKDDYNDRFGGLQVEE